MTSVLAAMMAGGKHRGHGERAKQATECERHRDLAESREHGSRVFTVFSRGFHDDTPSPVRLPIH
jgi:hypothetical protein